MNKDELYDKLTCALTHDLRVCEECKKCEGANGAYIRMNLVKELAKYMKEELPWKEEE